LKKKFYSKTNTGPHRKTTRGRHKSDTKHARKKRNAGSNICWQSVQDPCRTVFENRRRAWNRSPCRSDLKIGLFSENFPIFVTRRDCPPKMAKFLYKNSRQSVAKYQSQTIFKMLLVIQAIWP